MSTSFKADPPDASPLQSALAATRNQQPIFSCASCDHQWSEDVIWCPKCKVGYRAAQPAQPAQPGSGEVKRFEFVGRHMVEVAPGTTCGGTPFVMAADYDRLQSALTAVQRENADLNAAFNAFCELAREQQEYERAQLTAARKRIAELEHQLAEEED